MSDLLCDSQLLLSPPPPLSPPLFTFANGTLQTSAITFWGVGGSFGRNISALTIFFLVFWGGSSLSRPLSKLFFWWG